MKMEGDHYDTPSRGIIFISALLQTCHIDVDHPCGVVKHKDSDFGILLYI